MKVVAVQDVQDVLGLRRTDAVGWGLALLGGAGLATAVTFAWFSAPDLAITQVMVETLTTILLVLILFRLPAMRQLSTRAERLADLVLASAAGLILTVVLWQLLAARPPPAISDWLVANAYDGGHGRNIVNVILVDFRALDTLGEIFVLALAAVGVFALLRGRPPERKERA